MRVALMGHACFSVRRRVSAVFGVPALAALLVAATLHAQTAASLSFGGLFQDHAVLQRDRPIEVWGHAGNGEEITVSIAASTARARADASGRWGVTLPALSAGGPFVLTAQGSSGSRQAASDILVGDVFLCSGQSNMELPVRRAGDTDSEIRDSTNDTIRMLTVEHATSLTPLVDFATPLAWQSAA